MKETNELVVALAPVITGFRRLGIRHFVGGSVASSFHGAIRSTMDVDVVCELTADLVTPFIDLLGDEYYVSQPAVRDAVARKSCFNLIHMPTSFKVDVFVSRGRPYDIDAMQRASLQSLGEGNALEVPIATAEDSIVSKLEWYRLGGQTSERQWDDVCRLIKMLGDQADLNYLRLAANSLGVRDLLDQLLAVARKPT